MLGLYLQAGFKKAADITPSSLEGLQRAPVLWQTFLPSARHYKKYCKLVRNCIESTRRSRASQLQPQVDQLKVSHTCLPAAAR